MCNVFPHWALKVRRVVLLASGGCTIIQGKLKVDLIISVCCSSPDSQVHRDVRATTDHVVARFPLGGDGMSLDETVWWAPIPVAARSKALVCGLSLAGIAGSNPAGGMDVCVLLVLCVVR